MGIVQNCCRLARIGLLVTVLGRANAAGASVEAIPHESGVDLALGELCVTVTPQCVGPVRRGNEALVDRLWLSMVSGTWDELGSESKAVAAEELRVGISADRVEVHSEATIGSEPQGRWRLRRTVTLTAAGRLGVRYDKQILAAAPAAGYTYVTLGLAPDRYSAQPVEVEAAERTSYDQDGKARKEPAGEHPFAGPFKGVFGGVFSVAFPESRWAVFPETGLHSVGLHPYPHQYQLQCVGYPGTPELSLAIDLTQQFAGSATTGAPADDLDLPAAPSPVPGQRDRICLNGEWDFRPGGDRTAVPAFGWTTLRVPGSWGHAHGFEFDLPDGTASVRHAWYRLRFRPPANWNDGRRIVLAFDGVNYACTGYLDGQPVGGHVGGYAPFELDITPSVHFDRPNEFALHVEDEAFPVGHQAQALHSGIWRSVYLASMPKLHVENVFVMPSVREKRLTVRTWVRNDSDRAQEGVLSNRVWLAGKVALELPAAPCRVAPGTTESVEVSQPWPRPQLWGFGEYGSPTLYSLQTVLLPPGEMRLALAAADEPRDAVSTRFGFREFWCEGTEFRLNGKPFVIKGDLVGTSYLLQDNRQWITLYYLAERGANVNFIRLHSYHDLHPKDWYEVADELGMPIETQQYYRPKSPEHFAVIRSDWEGFIRRHWNHPSIVMWSADNEACSQADYGQPQVVDMPEVWQGLNEVHKLIRSLDPTRPVEEQGDVRLGLAAAKGLFDELQVFNAHPYGDPLGNDLDHLKQRYSYNGRIPIHVGEVYYGEQDPFNWWTRPAEMLRKQRSMYLSWRNCGKYYYRSILSVRDHGAAGVSLCAGIGTMYFGSKSEDDIRFGPWDCRQTDETFDSDRPEDRGRSVNNVYVKTRWPSLSGEGIKVKWVLAPSVGYGGQHNWFDPTRPAFETNVVYDWVRKGFHDWDGKHVAPLAKHRAPELVVCVTKGDQPVAGVPVWLLPEAAAAEPQAVLADANGTAWFILRQPGRYRAVCPAIGASQPVTLEAPRLRAQAGYGHLAWVDLGGQRSGAIRAELAKPAEIDIRDPMEKPSNRAVPAASKPLQAGPFAPDSQGCIRDWLVCGPFPNPGDREKGFSGFRRDFLEDAGGETAIQPVFGQSHAVRFPRSDHWLAKATTARWRDRHAASSEVDLRDLLNPDVGLELPPPMFVVGYAFCYVCSEVEQSAELTIGSDDGNRVWLNHRLVGEYPTHGAAVLDRSRYPVVLKAGRNPLLVKVDQSFGGYGFLLRFLRDGQPVTNLQVRLQ
jgi:hypothetical protein